MDWSKMKLLNEKVSGLKNGEQISVSIDFVRECFPSTNQRHGRRVEWTENFDKWALRERVKISPLSEGCFIISRD